MASDSRYVSTAQRCALFAAFSAWAVCLLTSCQGDTDAKAGGAAASAGDGSLPNVVICVVDTLRPDYLGVYGHDKPTSPAIDALAVESVVFEHAYSPAPWTLPAVVSLLIGTFPCEHLVLVDGQKIASEQQPLAERLSAAGFRTAAFISNPYAGKMTGLDRGVEKTVAQPPLQNTTGADLEPWLEADSKKPFFIYVHNIEPHNPCDVPAESIAPFGEVPADELPRMRAALNDFRRLTRVDFEAGQAVGTTDNTAAQDAAMALLRTMEPQIRICYEAAVRRADESVGSIIDMLKKRRVWDQTLFILVSDHGEEFDEHGGWLHDQSVYEELIHVPLIVHFPKGQYGGTRVASIVNLVDVLPTVAEVVGRPKVAENARGTSVVPLAAGAPAADSDAFHVVAVRMNRKKFYRPFKETRGDVNVALRQRNWKAIFNVETKSFELYELKEDAGETNDVADNEPDLARAMQRIAQTWFDECASGAAATAVPGTEGLDEATKQRLRSLGYVE